MIEEKFAGQSSDVHLQEGMSANDGQPLSTPMLVLVYGGIFAVTLLLFF